MGSSENTLMVFEPSSIDEALKLAGYLVSSGLLPDAIKKPEAALAVIMSGRELGLSVMQSLRSINIISGKPTLSADLMAALCKRSPSCKFFRLVESTVKVATYETERLGEGVTPMSFTIEEAQSAGLTGKGPWKQYPAAMLRARCIAALARAVYPDLLMGVYEESELEPSAPSPTSSVTVERRPAKRVTEHPPSMVDALMAARGDGDTVDAEVIEPAPRGAEEESEDQKVERWSAAFRRAPSMAELTASATEFAHEGASDAVRLRMSEVYNECKALCKAAKKKETANV